MTTPQLTMKSDQTHRWSKQKWFLLAAAFFTVALAIYFFNLEGERSISLHEGYAIIPAEEMLETGDWVVPMFGGLPRLQKPPLPYWMVALSSKICGETTGISLASARLPSAFSAILLAIFMGYWAFRWYGRTAGISVLFVQLTSFYAMSYGRKAEIDMFNFLLMTVAMFLIAESNPSESRKKYHLRWIAIFALLSVSWLAKFHFGLVMVFAPCLIFLLVQKRYKEILNFVHPIGLLLLFAAVTIWPYLITQQLPEAWGIWNQELIGRATSHLGGIEFPIWFYLPMLFSLPLPWTPFALAAIPRSFWRAWKRKDSREQFLWIWLGVQIVIVTIQPVKHKHYIIPALPVFSLWAGQSICKIVASVKDGNPILTKQWAYFWTILIFGGLTTAIVLVNTSLTLIRNPILIISIISGITGIVAIWMLYRKQWTVGIVSVAIMFLVADMGATGWIIPRRDHRISSVYFVKDVRLLLSKKENVCMYGLEQDPMIYYLKKPVFRIENSVALQTQLNKQQRIFIITREKHIPDLVKLGQFRIIKKITTPPNCTPPRYTTHIELLLAELATPQFVQKNKSNLVRIMQAMGQKKTIKQ